MTIFARFKALLRAQSFYRPVRRERLRRLANAPDTLPRWSRLLGAAKGEWRQDPGQRTGPRVLLATGGALHFTETSLDSLLSVALGLRGARVDVLHCDGALPACMLCHHHIFPQTSWFVREGPQKDLCPTCFSSAVRVYAELGTDPLKISDWLTSEDRDRAETVAAMTPYDAIATLEIDGIKVGEQARAGALRYFARGNFADEPLAEPVLRRYLKSALLMLFAVRRILAAGAYDVVVAHHGIYVPQGIVTAEARRSGVRVVTWHTAYRERCFIFSHDDTYHRTMLDEPTEAWEGLALTTAQQERIRQYLVSRQTGGQDWIAFLREPEEDITAIETALHIDFSRPTVSLFTSVVWDAQLHYPGNAFASMQDWVVSTISYFAGRPELQLVIRIHPAEVSGALPSRQRLAKLIAEHFPTLPENVRVIPPEHKASSYAIAKRSDCALIYNTKMGIELASMGIPVIVAGEAWIRNKGLSFDPRNQQEYERLLDRLPLGERLSSEQQMRALTYAYHFFFRRMIPLDAVEGTGQWPFCRVAVSGVEDLMPGHDPGLDVICGGILTKSPFIFPAEQH